MRNRRSPEQVLQAPERKDGTPTRECRAFALQIKAKDDGTVEGYGSVFDNLDAYNDAIAKGAFKDSLKAHKAAGTMPAMLWQHDAGEPIGVWTDMVEDERGLKVVGKLALETTRGREAHALLKMGALNGLSIGFMSKQWAYDKESDVRTLTEVDLWEVSLVTFPANGAARVTSVKAADVAGLQTIRQAEKALRDAGFSSDAAKAFVAEVKRIALAERDAQEAGEAVTAAQKLLASLSNS